MAKNCHVGSVTSVAESGGVSVVLVDGIGKLNSEWVGSDDCGRRLQSNGGRLRVGSSSKMVSGNLLPSDSQSSAVEVLGMSRGCCWLWTSGGRLRSIVGIVRGGTTSSQSVEEDRANVDEPIS